MPAPFWGIRSDAESFELRDRCRDFVPRLGRVFFSHTTAARLWGLPVPLAHELDDRLHVAFARGHRAPSARGIVGHELAVEGGDVVTLDGLPVTAPTRLVRDLSAILDVPDLVAVLDAALRRRMIDGSRLERHLEIRGYRGRPRLVAAIPLCDSGAESPQESLLRIALVRAGLPALSVNPEVRDAAGRFVARVDLKFDDHPVVVEYDGDGHRSSVAQWRRDVDRYADLEELGLSVVRATGDDSPGFPRTIARATRALARHGWTPSKPMPVASFGHDTP